MKNIIENIEEANKKDDWHGEHNICYRCKRYIKDTLNPWEVFTGDGLKTEPICNACSEIEDNSPKIKAK